MSRLRQIKKHMLQLILIFNPIPKGGFFSESAMCFSNLQIEIQISRQ